MDRLEQAAKILESEFGSEWKQIVQELGTENLRKRVGKELTSFIAFPNRGNGGDYRWRGNCSPEVIASVLNYVLECKKYEGKDTRSFSMIDPMSGSGTSLEAAKKFQIQPYLYDLNPDPPYGKGNWNALKDDVENSADFIFLHPPYHRIIQYSGNIWGKPHTDDLSRCETYNDFIERLNAVIGKLFFALRKDGRMAILVGDIRMKGNFYSIQNDMMKMGNIESIIVKAQYNCVSDSRRYPKPFIPIVTEYLILLHKRDSLLIPFTVTGTHIFNAQKQDAKGLTWNHLIRVTMELVGGKASLAYLYQALSEHPKSKKNAHYKERIRATIYEHKEQYISDKSGSYQLNYTVN